MPYPQRHPNPYPYKGRRLPGRRPQPARIWRRTTAHQILELLHQQTHPTS